MIDRKTDAVILDVDGTLWDSTPIVARAWQSAVADSGLTDYVVTAERLKGLFGKTMQVIAERNHFLAPVYVGDTQGDYDAAKETGVRFIHASYGYGKVDCAEETIAEFSGLLE